MVTCHTTTPSVTRQPHVISHTTSTTMQSCDQSHDIHVHAIMWSVTRPHDIHDMPSVTRPSQSCDQSHDHRNHVISHTTTRPWRQPHVISHTTIPIMWSVTRPHDHDANHMWSVTRPRNQSHDICNQSHDHPNHVISHTTTPSVTRPHDHPRPPFIYSGSFTKLFSSNGPHSPLIHFITTFFILQHITYERNSSIYSLHYYWKFPY
jgi:hypothetical protein